MRKGVVIGGLVAAYILGCTPSTPAERIVSKWNINAQCTLDQAEETKSLPLKTRMSLADFIRPVTETFFFTFEKDGRLEIKRNHITEALSYSVIRTLNSNEIDLKIFESSRERSFPAQARFDDSSGILHLTLNQTHYCLSEF